MWVETIDVRGFRHLDAGRLTLTPGLTIVTGPNEAGKTTVHDLLVRLLFGYSKPERRRKRDGVSLKDESRPWDGRRPFAANATLRDVRGHSLVVEWDFEDHTVTLRDADTNENLSADVRGKREDSSLGEHLLCIGLEEFREVCCLHQAAVSAVGHSEELVLVLQRSVEMGSPDIGVEDADARLSEFLRDRLGVHSGHYGELPRGALARRRDDLRAAQTKLGAVESDRAEIETLAANVQHRRAERDEVVDQLESSRQQLLRTEIEALQAQRSKAVDLVARQAQRPADPVRLPTSVADEVRAGFDRLSHSRERLVRLERDAEAATPELERLTRLREQRQQEVDALSLYRAVDAKGRSRFAELERGARADEALTRDAETATRELEALLGGETLALLERRSEEAAHRHREHVTRHGTLAAEAGDRTELTRSVERLQGALRPIELEVRETETSIATREDALADAAVLREEIARLESEIDWMEIAREGIKLAREALAAAARDTHREFAPHLNRALERNLSRITGGRYQDATVGERLEITVRAPETGRRIRVDQLSRGTQDQIYLVERLEIAKLLDPTTGEAPLLLDDPFARFDEERLRLGLEVIRDVATERQVVLFSGTTFSSRPRGKSATDVE